MKAELDSRASGYTPLIADLQYMHQWGSEVGQSPEFFPETVLQENHLLSLSFKAGDTTYQFTDLKHSDYKTIRSWLAGELENNKSSLSPFAGALTGLAVGRAASEFKTRRQFIRSSIKTAGLTVAGAALSSCTPGERISSQTDALLQTATAIHMGEVTPSPKPVTYRTPSADTQVAKTEEGYTISTITPELTPSPTLTVMEVLKELEVANWAEDDAGNIDPDILYPIVGSVHNANKRTVDLTDKSSGLKLAVILGEDTNMEDANLKQEIADQLNNQETLKEQIEEINNQLPENEKKSAIIVINGEALNSNQVEVTQIAIRSNLPIEKRYLLENGTLRQMLKEEEPLLMAELEIRGPDFFSEGKPVVMRGATAPNYTWDRRADYQEFFKRDLNILKDWGGDFVNIHWNSGLLDDNNYIEELVEATEYARGLGFRVELGLVARSKPEEMSNYYDSKGIRSVDVQLVKDWEKLLSDRSIAKRISKSVDVFGIVQEPSTDANGGSLMWDEMLDIYDKATNIIRDKLGRKAIVTYSANDLASDAEDLLNYEANRENTTIEFHPYSQAEYSHIKPTILKLRENGWCVVIGEFGWVDPLSLVEEQIQFFIDNNISFSMWGLWAQPDDEYLLLIGDYGDINGYKGPSSLGKILQKYLLFPKFSP